MAKFQIDQDLIIDNIHTILTEEIDSDIIFDRGYLFRSTGENLNIERQEGYNIVEDRAVAISYSGFTGEISPTLQTFMEYGTINVVCVCYQDLLADLFKVLNNFKVLMAGKRNRIETETNNFNIVYSSTLVIQGGSNYTFNDDTIATLELSIDYNVSNTPDNNAEILSVRRLGEKVVYRTGANVDVVDFDFGDGKGPVKAVLLNGVSDPNNPTYSQYTTLEEASITDTTELYKDSSFQSITRLTPINLDNNLVNSGLGNLDEIIILDNPFKIIDRIGGMEGFSQDNAPSPDSDTNRNFIGSIQGNKAYSLEFAMYDTGNPISDDFLNDIKQNTYDISTDTITPVDLLNNIYEVLFEDVTEEKNSNNRFRLRRMIVDSITKDLTLGLFKIYSVTMSDADENIVQARLEVLNNG